MGRILAGADDKAGILHGGTVIILREREEGSGAPSSRNMGLGWRAG